MWEKKRRIDLEINCGFSAKDNDGSLSVIFHNLSLSLSSNALFYNFEDHGCGDGNIEWERFRIDNIVRWNFHKKNRGNNVVRACKSENRGGYQGHMQE